MREIEFYQGREQTFLKHYVLEKYIEKLGYKVGSWADSICYVDCFSGPWKSADENYKDTSISISLDVFKRVKGYYEKTGRKIHFKCIYIEQNPKSFQELKKILSSENEIETEAINGKFIESIPQVLKKVGKSFTFFFIDPTGWTEFYLNDINKIINRVNSEVIINFMYDFIQRFIDTNERHDLGESFDKLFGTANWRCDIGNLTEMHNEAREDCIVNYYINCLKNSGRWNYAVNSKITYPLKDKTYFHLIYATRHLAGLKTFKRIDADLFSLHMKIRDEAKRKQQQEKLGGQLSLFEVAEGLNVSLPFNDIFLQRTKDNNFKKMRDWLIIYLSKEKRVKYKDILEKAIQFEMVYEKDVNNLIIELKKCGNIDILGMSSRERIPKDENIIVSLR